MRVNDHPAAVGIDLGTTTISAAALDLETGELLETKTIPNAAALPSPTGIEREQDTDKICAAAERLLDGIAERYRVSCIGLTGQMHGIVYLGADGKTLSPLYTWQDGRAGVGSPSPCERIAALTGYGTAPGYGLATHYANHLTGSVPAGAKKLATVMDCFGVQLTGRKAPLIHAQNAASLGLFDTGAMRFDTDAATKLGLDPSILPDVTTRAEFIGEYRDVPVCAAIGDNQAAFLGAVRDPETSALANFGTGSQISLAVCPGAEVITSRSLELRPFLEDRMLASGSALYGGAAYALLERFFRAYAEEAGFEGGEQYEILNRLALAAEDGPVLSVRTTFGGTRDDPELKGLIADVTAENFTPGALAVGVLAGMAEELYGLYERIPHDGVKTLVLSGNAARKNPALQKIVKRVFGLDVLIPICREEAALGSALFAADAAGFDGKTARRCLAYTAVE